MKCDYILLPITLIAISLRQVKSWIQPAIEPVEKKKNTF